MATDWAEFAKNIAPVGTGLVGVIGVWIGSRFNGRLQRQAFTRERVFAELSKRREVGTDFRKALWSLGARVSTMRELARKAAKAKSEGSDISRIQYNIEEARNRQNALRDSFAILESYATIQVQIPARACMEALVHCFNHCTALEINEADAKWAAYEQQHEKLALELNKESDHFNAIIYASFTPVWRALLRHTLRKPLPYKAFPSFTAEIRNRQEKLTIMEASQD